ncbi:MAG: hypothetical protein JOZ58_18085 [Acetobacteraceae bacterium]|nr:hypothetical protein [Acetobacteraceae bacterium]
MDGIAGRMTFSALRQFEDDQRLPASAKLDEDTVEHLIEAIASLHRRRWRPD